HQPLRRVRRRAARHRRRGPAAPGGRQPGQQRRHAHAGGITDRGQGQVGQPRRMAEPPAGGGNALAVARAVPGSPPAPPPPSPEPASARGQARGWAPAPAGHAADTGDPYAAVVLEVADHGAGLTQEQAEHVFERFYRADQARSRRAGGTGLGLAIVAALVAAHDGTASVGTPPGRDATFRIAQTMAPRALAPATVTAWGPAPSHPT